MTLDWAALDRGIVLVLGVLVGTAIGLSFGGPSGAETRSAPAAVVRPAPAIPKAAPEVMAARGCVGPYRQQLARTLLAGKRVRVGVFGDSFGDGVWSGLDRQLTRRDGYEVLRLSREATGFTRYRSLNLERHAAEQLGDVPLDFAVISFGANDAQGIITDRGHYAPFLSDLWKAEVGARVDRFVALLRAHRAMVYWVGLPRMAKPGLDGDVGAINAFYAGRMAALGVPFFDTRKTASDARGDYAAYLNDEHGVRTRIRVEDGIHMSMTGYVWITRDLAERMRLYVGAVRTMAGAPEPAPRG